MPRLAALLKPLVTAALLLSAGVLFAAAGGLSLDDAKRQGLVGETVEGYLAAVKGSPSAAVKALVDDVNAKRRAEYQRIARENGLELSQVEALAARKAIEKTPPGDWVRVNGDWRRK